MVGAVVVVVVVVEVVVVLGMNAALFEGGTSSLPGEEGKEGGGRRVEHKRLGLTIVGAHI